jgi:hypothetical protein
VNEKTSQASLRIDMSQVSMTPAERARKSHAIALQLIAAVGQNMIATEIGVSPPTISRFVSDDLERACQVIAAAGVKVVPAGRICVDQAMYQAMVTIATGALSSPEAIQKLVWEE